MAGSRVNGKALTDRLKMSILGIGVSVVGVAIVVANVVTSRSLWLSPMFERSQKVAQTVFIWIVPGAFVAVRHLLHESDDRRAPIDPTIHPDYSYRDDPGGGSHGHGGDGGHV